MKNFRFVPAEPHLRAMRAGAACVALMVLTALACQRQTTPVPHTVTELPDAEVKAAVDRAIASTGDVLTYTVDVERNPDIEVDLAEPGADIAGLRIVDVGKDAPVQVDGRTRERRWYKLRADLVGSYVLPPLKATSRARGAPIDTAKALQTSEIFIEVQSVLPTDGSAHDIRGVKPLQVVRYRARWPFVAAGLAAVVLLLGGIAWWWRTRRAPVKAVTPPHEVAFAALNALRRSNFSDLQAVRRYYFAISEVVRAYVEGRFGLNATDLTTEEILTWLQHMDALPTAERDRLRAFLTDTDRVKFAGHVPTPPEVAETYERALGFVEATRPAAPAPVAA